MQDRQNKFIDFHCFQQNARWNHQMIWNKCFVGPMLSPNVKQGELRFTGNVFFSWRTALISGESLSESRTIKNLVASSIFMAKIFVSSIRGSVKLVRKLAFSFLDTVAC